MVAVEDLDEAHRYIAQNNPDAADRVREDILTAAERLAKFPSLGHPGRLDETREFVVTGTPYKIAYTRSRSL